MRFTEHHPGTFFKLGVATLLAILAVIALGFTSNMKRIKNTEITPGSVYKINLRAVRGADIKVQVVEVNGNEITYRYILPESPSQVDDKVSFLNTFKQVK